MHPQRLLVCVALFLGLLASTPWSGSVVPLRAQAPAASAEAPVNSKTWVGKHAEFEEFLKTAEVTNVDAIPIGVTKPMKATLAEGGPVSAFAWKTIPPGRHGGYWESYKNEIAAYEVDKLLGLDMVPPTVERRVKNILGAAVMWVSPTRSFKDLGGMPTPPPVHFARWNREVVKAKMFDNLIGNLDPNLGNWLVDPAWNLILIDHTRCFTTDKRLTHDLQRVDAELWERMQQLTEDQLDKAIGQYLVGGAVRSMIQRRDKMVEAVKKLIDKNGEAAVLVR